MKRGGPQARRAFLTPEMRVAQPPESKVLKTRNKIEGLKLLYVYRTENAGSCRRSQGIH